MIELSELKLKGMTFLDKAKLLCISTEEGNKTARAELMEIEDALDKLKGMEDKAKAQKISSYFGVAKNFYEKSVNAWEGNHKAKLEAESALEKKRKEKDSLIHRVVEAVKEKFEDKKRRGRPPKEK